MSARPFLGSDSVDLSARKPYDIIDEPVGDLYWGILDSALPQCDSAILRCRAEGLSSAGKQFVTELEPFTLSRSPESATGSMVRFTLNQHSAAILKSATTGLYGWREPDLPEDLCLFRRDGSPWLVTVSRERLGYVELTAFEKLLLARAAPGLPGALAHQAARDAILAVFERRFEAALEPLVAEMALHARPYLDEGRDGLVDSLGEWLESGDPTRVHVALEVIAALHLDEFSEEIEGLRRHAHAGQIAPPAVFRSNAVLSDRWLAHHRRLLDDTVAALTPS